MGRPHPMALRERVMAFVEEGHSHRAAGTRFRVSVKFVNHTVILKRETGVLEQHAQGNAGGHGNSRWQIDRAPDAGATTLDVFLALPPSRLSRYGCKTCKRRRLLAGQVSDLRHVSQNCTGCDLGDAEDMLVKIAARAARPSSAATMTSISSAT